MNGLQKHDGEVEAGRVGVQLGGIHHTWVRRAGSQRMQGPATVRGGCGQWTRLVGQVKESGIYPRSERKPLGAGK